LKSSFIMVGRWYGTQDLPNVRKTEKKRSK